MEKGEKESDYISNALKSVRKWYKGFENILSIAVSALLATILMIIVFRLFYFSYILIFSKIGNLAAIHSDDITDIFGKVITLFITVEFLNSIIRSIKGGELKGLVKDVILITALAMGRKLIVMDFSATSSLNILSIGGVLISLGVFYFLSNGTSRGLSVFRKNSFLLKTNKHNLKAKRVQEH